MAASTRPLEGDKFEFLVEQYFYIYQNKIASIPKDIATINHGFSGGSRTAATSKI